MPLNRSSRSGQHAAGAFSCAVTGAGMARGEGTARWRCSIPCLRRCPPSIVPTPGPLAGYGTATLPAPPRLAHSQADDELTIGADVELGFSCGADAVDLRESAGAVEPEDAIPKSRGALLAGILVAALAAGGVTAFLGGARVRKGPPPAVQPAVTNRHPHPRLLCLRLLPHCQPR